jgi:hypothetical protein
VDGGLKQENGGPNDDRGEAPKFGTPVLSNWARDGGAKLKYVSCVIMGQ